MLISLINFCINCYTITRAIKRLSFILLNYISLEFYSVEGFIYLHFTFKTFFTYDDFLRSTQHSVKIEKSMETCGVYSLHMKIGF